MRISLFFLLFLLGIKGYTQTPTMNCPSNVIVPNDPGSCGAIVNYTEPTCATNCTGAVITQTDATGLTTGSFFPIDTTQLEYEIRSGAQASVCVFLVIVQDVEAPTITSYNTSISQDNDPTQCGATVNYSMPVATDNCGGTITFQQIDLSGYTNGDLFPAGTTVQSYEAVDAHGNIGDTATFYITVSDTTSPVILCPGNQVEYVDASCGISLGDYTGLGSATDNCGPYTISQNPFPNTYFSGAGNTVTMSLTATDTSGNFSFCFFDLVLVDTLAPSITCVADQNVTPSSGCSAILQDYTNSPSVTDNCDSNPVITQSPSAGSTITSSQVVTLYATDASGNIDSCSFNVVVDDPIAPTVVCPNDSTVYSDISCGYSMPDFISLVQYTDNCDPNPTISQTPSVGTVIPGGTTQFVSFNVTDVSGNSSYCSFLLTVTDTIGPTFTCLSDKTVYVDQYCDYTLGDYTGMVSATDNCGGNVFVNQSPLPGTQFSNASTQNITISAYDNKGNVTNCTFQLFILDTVAPSIVSCANDTTISANSNCEYLLADFTGFLSAVDTCSATNTYTQSIAVGTSLPVGSTTTLKLYATDLSGNSDSCSIDINVVDDTPPVLVCPTNPSVPANSSCEYIIPDYSSQLTMYDNCDPSISYSQTVSAGTIISGIGTQQNVSIFVSDASGNNNSCSFVITLVDTLAPTITCPSDTLINMTGSSCQFILPDLTAGAVALDYCDNSPLITQNPNIGVVLSGVVTVTLTAHDASGNSTYCQFHAMGNDTVSPTINCPGDFTTCDSIVTYNTPVGIDDCSVPVTSQIDATGLSSGSVFPVGQTVLTYQTVDQLNNITYCSFKVTRYPPVSVDAGNDTLIQEGATIQLHASVTSGAAYNWSPTYGLDDITSLSPSITPTASVEYYLTATNSDGCTATDSVFIFVNTISDLEINNFLSPNGDGKNDTWNMNKPALVSGCQVSIFNTWGKVVWTSNAYANDWDGKNQNGEDLPDGTYFYIISNCQGYDTEGSIMLMR